MIGSINKAAVSIMAGSVSASSDAYLTSSSAVMGISPCKSLGACLMLRIRKLVVRKRQIIDLNMRASSDAHTNFFDAF